MPSLQHPRGWLDMRYLAGSFVEAWESKGGFDPLCFVVLFELNMKFLDWLDGNFENGTTNEMVDCRSPSDCCHFNSIGSIHHFLLL
jgi:hypothetical protein